MPTVFIPFTNFSLSRGRLNSGALVRADGVAHLGHGYAAPSPLFVKGDPFDEVDHEIQGPVQRPAFAAMNRNESSSAPSLVSTMHYFENRQGAPPTGEIYNWTVFPPNTFPPVTSHVGTIDAITDEEAGQWAPFGVATVLAAGHDQPVKIILVPHGADLDCFTSTDKPQAKYVTSIGERLLFANIANTGTAGDPDPNTSLVWWGATDDARSIGNPIDNPEMASDFQHLADQYGDITGLAGGKRVAYIFKELGIYQMGLTNTLFGYGFDLISAGIGTVHSRSIVAQGEEVYFWSNLGPAVIRGGQVLLLGDGYWTSRGLLEESPPHPNFKVLGAAADVHNGQIIWHVQYDFHTYDYDGEAEPPTDTVGGILTGDALIAYSYLSNQFTFLKRPKVGDVNFQIAEFSSTPPLTVAWTLRCIVNGLPWDQHTMPLSGVGMVMNKTGGSGDPNDILARVLISGYPEGTDDHTNPERVIAQNPYFATGMIQLSQDENVMVNSVRPIVRGRRARPVPTMRAWVRSSLTPFDVERIYGPFSSGPSPGPSVTAYSDRNGWIRTPGVAQGNFAAIELEIASWSGEPWSQIRGEFAFWLEDIEGVEVQFTSGGSAK